MISRKVILMDKRWAVILLLFLAMFIFGCTQQYVQPETPAKVVPPTEEAAPVEQPQVQEPVVEKPVVEKPVTPPKEEVVDDGYNFDQLPMDQQRKIKSIRTLLKTARENEEDYFFRYSGPGIVQTDVWVKGNVQKRSILRLDEVDKYHQYNIVYLYKDTKKAEGYCETTKSACPNGHGPFPESYDKWYVKTPKDWVVDLGDNFYWALDNKIDDVLYHIIDYRADGKTTRVYVRDYKGWPGKIEIHSTEKPDSINAKSISAEYTYDDMDVSGISDDAVTPGGVIHS
jgi:hypothetical protein